MSSSINLNLTGVGDEFAAAAVEAMRKQQATSESSVLIGKEIAKQIGKEVSEHVAASLQTALPDLQNPPVFNLREQILANANFILACYGGEVLDEREKHVAVASYGEHTSAFPTFWQLCRPASQEFRPQRICVMTTLLKGPAATSDIDALKGLEDVSKRVSARAWELYSSSGKRFHDLEELNT